MKTGMQTKNGQNSFVRGYHHHMRFENGFRVYGWTPNKISRADAVTDLLEIANGGTYACDYDKSGKLVCAYDREVIESYWITKGDSR